MKIRVHIIVSGYVQGIGYRYFAVHKAQTLGLCGYVKNLVHNQVESVVEGDNSLVDQFIQALKVGPSGSRITKVEISTEPYINEFNTFSIRH